VNSGRSEGGIRNGEQGGKEGYGAMLLYSFAVNGKGERGLWCRSAKATFG